MLTSLSELRDRKRHGPPLAVLTAYDYPTARLMDEAGVDLILVGDSLGMVVLGLPDTTGVTMEMMLHHTAAVRRGVKRAPIIGDLPFHSYRTPEEALQNARRRVAARLPRAPCRVRKLKATASPGSISHSRIVIPSASGSGTTM